LHTLISMYGRNLLCKTVACLV